jgi:hypothetical protein
MSARSDDKTKKSDVLYQRLGNRWYAFSVVDGDVFFAEVPPETITASEVPAYDPQETANRSAVVTPGKSAKN